MGVRFNREYNAILADLSEVLAQLPDSAEFVEMDPAEWMKLSPKSRNEMAQTIADDLFFALGDEPSIEFGNLKIQYDSISHRIFLQSQNGDTHIIKLI